MTNIICTLGAVLSVKSFLIDPRISFPLCQNPHLYQSLPHAHREFPEHVLEKQSSVTKVGPHGSFFFFGFSDFRIAQIWFIFRPVDSRHRLDHPRGVVEHRDAGCIC